MYFCFKCKKSRAIHICPECGLLLKYKPTKEEVKLAIDALKPLDKKRVKT